MLASLGALLRDADEARQSDASQDVYIISDHVCMQCFMPPAMLLNGLGLYGPCNSFFCPDFVATKCVKSGCRAMASFQGRRFDEQKIAKWREGQ